MAIVSVRYGEERDRPRLLRAIGERPLPLWLLAIAGYVGLSLWLPASPFLFLRSQQIVAHVALGAIAALAFVPAAFADRPGGLAGRLLAHLLLAWLGLVSYGSFLWHYVGHPRAWIAGRWGLVRAGAAGNAGDLGSLRRDQLLRRRAATAAPQVPLAGRRAPKSTAGAARAS